MSDSLLTAVPGQGTTILLAPQEHSLDEKEGMDPQGCNLGMTSRHSQLSQLYHHSSAGLVTAPSIAGVGWRRKPQNLLFSPFSQLGQSEDAAWFPHAQQHSHVYRSPLSPSKQHDSEYFLEAFQATSLCVLS